MDFAMVQRFWLNNGAVTKEGNTCFCTNKSVLLHYHNILEAVSFLGAALFLCGLLTAFDVSFYVFQLIHDSSPDLKERNSHVLADTVKSST